MQLHVLLEKPLTHSARIYVKEQSADPRCVHHYEANSDHNALMFRVPLSTCGMQRIQQKTHRFSFVTSVVVSFHRFFLSNRDRGFRLSCDYADVYTPPQATVTSGIGVEEQTESDVKNMYPEVADCSYQLFSRTRNATISLAATTVHVGDELEHRWSCNGLMPGQFVFVHDCTVNPEFPMDEGDPILVDSYGCVVDDAGIGQIMYSNDGFTAYSRHQAYKFADYPNLLFKCALTICRADTCVLKDGSFVSFPPNCKNHTRTTRSTSTIIPDNLKSIELSELVRVDDSSLEGTQLSPNKPQVTDTSTLSTSVHTNQPRECTIAIIVGAFVCLLAFLVLIVVCIRKQSKCQHCACER
uniref:ZP domain-containing protein n=1 Tax=Panagrellus redivivus TaxID=6233 RepID=A0A7E4VRD8_PANRE